MKIKLCPRCGSTKVDLKPTPLQADLGMMPNYKCLKCGYESDIFAEKEK